MRQRLAITSLASAWLALASATAGAQQCDPDGDGVCSNVPAQLCTDTAGNKGRCSQRTYSCDCVSSLAVARDVAVHNAFEASHAILQLEELFLELDPEVACGTPALAEGFASTVPTNGAGLVGGQLLELTNDLERTLDRLERLGRVGSVTPKTYGHLDHTIATIPRIARIAELCGMTLNVGTLQSRYVGYKSDLELDAPLEE